MGHRTGIAWTDSTFNPWHGCSKVSPGCDNCYAERDSKRFGEGTLWGVDADRREFTERHWNEPRKWNRMAEIAALATGARTRVFCASMADVFDNHSTAERLRPRLWQLIRETPNLDWQILTKRIGNAARMLPADWGDGYANVWLGASVVTQAEVDRDVPRLLAVPARVRFLSCEPLLEIIDLVRGGWTFLEPLRPPPGNKGGHERGLDWVIVGGESGTNARPFDLSWARSIVTQCRAAGVPVFVKQLGARCRVVGPEMVDDECEFMRLRDRAGADPSEWPADLRVQEFPR